MIRHRSTRFLAATCVLIGFGWALSVSRNPGLEPAIAQSSVNLPDSFLVAQSSSPETSERPLLKLGSQGPDVAEVQTKLKQLGYYNGVVDGKYGASTEVAVSKFKKSVDLESSGIVGSTTWGRLQAAAPQRQGTQATTSQPITDNTPRWQKLPWLLPGAVAAIAIVGGGIAFLRKPRLKIKKSVKPKSRQEQDNLSTQPERDNLSTEDFQTNGITSETDTIDPDYSTNGHTSSDVTVSIASHPIETTTRLSKIDIVSELIKDLRGRDPHKRRKAIWELAQKGDSRAVQPLVDLLIDADSKQRCLILEALSQIGAKTLTPMNRALAISLQDDNAEVRKNAIRDLTQIYEQVAQVSQILCHAADDPDPEVQETARWAMTHLSRIRSAATIDNLPSSRSTLNLPSQQDKKPTQ